MKVLVQFSGGKDSLASLLWAVENFGPKVIAVFCDTEWEHEYTYAHVRQVVGKLGIGCVWLKGKKSFLELAESKKRFPSTKARFCTEELKVKPFIDWILANPDNYYIVQGIRKDESNARSKMNENCTLFRHYFEPYKIDAKGKKRFHTYRSKEVKAFAKSYVQDVFRPIFEWNAAQVFEFIKAKGFEANPLYKLGFKRVGCFPCIMCTHQELKEIAEAFPETLQRLKSAEEQIGRSFFPPDYIPSHQTVNGSFPMISEAVAYVTREKTIQLFEPETCKSYYSLCE